MTETNKLDAVVAAILTVAASGSQSAGPAAIVLRYKEVLDELRKGGGAASTKRQEA